MMVSLQRYVHQGKYRLRDLARNPKIHLLARASGHFLAGFALSAASLNNACLPLSMALACAQTGWASVLACLGSGLGYWLFWGSAGYQGLLWAGVALLVSLSLGDHRLSRETPLLLPAVAGLIVSASGVIFQAWLRDTAPVETYLLRVSLASGATWLFRRVLQGRNPILDWLTWALAVLSLAQISLFPGFSLGVLAAGAVAVSGAFPAVVLSGLSLDLAHFTPVSMTAALCGSFLIRFLPHYPRYLGAIAPAGVYLLVMRLTGQADYLPLAGLALGGVLGVFLPLPRTTPNRRGETGVAQVRLEMVAGVLSQTRQLLLETPEVPVDEDALLMRAAAEACNSCPCRKNCKDTARLPQLPTALLHKPLLTPEELPIICRKSGRFLAGLHRSQEQLRSIEADRQRQREYRTAVTQQYGFLSEYLQDLSDGLTKRIPSLTPYFTPKVQVFGNRPAQDNGDRCFFFAGTACRYYVLLCDGMGTGLGAIAEAKSAGGILRRLLTAGYPATNALESLNSLCALQNHAGAVTVDLLELQLETGKATLHKWGAPPSYLVSPIGAEKIGTAGPPPGLSVTDSGETTYRLSLHRGEILVLVSDGIAQADALKCCLERVGLSPGDLAEGLLTRAQFGGEDDATVVTVQLGQKDLHPS